MATYIPTRVRDEMRTRAGIYAVRAAKKTSFEDVARTLNVTANAVRAWDTGTRPAFALAEKILGLYHPDGASK